MFTAEKTLKFVDHSVGDVCTFGIKDSASVYLDESIKRFRPFFDLSAAPTAPELNIEKLC